MTLQEYQWETFLLEKTELSISQPLSAPNTFIYRVLIDWINPCDDGENCSSIKKTSNKSTTRMSVPILFQIRYNRIYVEISEEETCEQAGLTKS